jgi:hypothetical protein
MKHTLYNQHLVKFSKYLTCRIRLPPRARCTTLCDKVCQWLAAGRWFSPGPLVSSTNTTDRYDIICLPVTCKQNKHVFYFMLSFFWTFVKIVMLKKSFCEWQIWSLFHVYSKLKFVDYDVGFDSRLGRGVQHYVIKFVSDLRQVDGFLRALWFPPPIQLTATI